ncbi:MAG: hypothetical protein WCW03_01395 [Candidatus Paceibacterota bacterium]|jgi:hypothetical protein
MNIFNLTKIKIPIIILCIVAIVIVTIPFPKNVNAQEGAASSAATVPINTGLDYNTTMQKLKSFTLDKIASMIAKRILHQMTISIVNWINSGFEGSPAFLTNPESFFMDVGDQITGQFISETGVLSKLCTPFGLDLRLSLAIGQAQLMDKRYACTLSTVIDNAMNARANVSINSSPGGATIGDIVNGNILNNPNQLSVNGRSANNTRDFIEGNFSKGGWPAFIALTSQPQNNPTGAWLMAQSDLQSSIARKQNAINTDLNRSSGFLSWPKCETLETLYPGDTPNYSYASDPRYTLKSGSDGSTIVQVCSTQTPGSVISGTLENQLGSAARELELADNINAIIDALVSQMVTKVLSNGLTSVSSNTGGRVSVTSQIQANSVSTYNQQIIYNQSQASDMTSRALTSLQEYKAIYDRAIALVRDSQQRFQTARSCFVNKINIPSSSLTINEISFAQRQMTNIDAILNQRFQPTLSQLTIKSAEAETKITSIRNLPSNQLSYTTYNVQGQTDNYSNAVDAAISVNSNAAENMVSAQKDLDAVDLQVTGWNAEATSYQRSCDLFPERIKDPSH